MSSQIYHMWTKNGDVVDGISYRFKFYDVSKHFHVVMLDEKEFFQISKFLKVGITVILCKCDENYMCSPFSLVDNTWFQLGDMFFLEVHENLKIISCTYETNLHVQKYHHYIKGYPL